MAGAFDAELAVDRLEAELAAELPAHMRAFATAYATGQPIPRAPEAARRASTIRQLAGLLSSGDVVGREGDLVSRALSLLRLLVPIAIEEDPAVAAARGLEPSWDSWPRLAGVRDAGARARFGSGHVALLHELHGC